MTETLHIPVKKISIPELQPLPKNWLTAKQAAAYLQVERRTLLTWTRQAKLKAYPLSGTRRKVWRFLHADLDAMLLAPSVALTNGRIQ